MRSVFIICGIIFSLYACGVFAAVAQESAASILSVRSTVPAVTVPPETAPAPLHQAQTPHSITVKVGKPASAPSSTPRASAKVKAKTAKSASKAARSVKVAPGNVHAVVGGSAASGLSQSTILIGLAGLGGLGLTAAVASGTAGTASP